MTDVYSIGDIRISPYVKNISPKDLGTIKSGFVVCPSSLFDGKMVAVLSANTSVTLVLAGCDLSEEKLLLAKSMQNRVLVLPVLDSFGSTQFLMRSLKDGSAPKKGILRYVKNGRLTDKAKCINEIGYTLSSLLYLVSEAISPVKSHYGKLFDQNGQVRFNALFTLENEAVFFFEQKYSSSMPASEYWEYAFRDGILVSDSFREMPLMLVSEDGESRLLDPLRISGNTDKIVETLVSCSQPIGDYSGKASAKSVSCLFDEFGLGGGV